MMKNKHSKYTSGFTIVELLVVIVVIAILAAITVVSYNGIQRRATDTAALNNGNAVIKLMHLYRSANGHYPTMTMTEGQMYCIGTSNPQRQCWPGVNESDKTVTNQLATMGTVPTPMYIKNIGPQIYVASATHFEIVTIVNDTSACPMNVYTSVEPNMCVLMIDTTTPV